MFFKIQKTSTEAVQITKPLTTRFFIEYTSLEFLIKTKANFTLTFKYKHNLGGLGDIIRGITNCLVLSKILEVPLYFDIQHPISNHFIFNKINKSDNEEFDLIDYTLYNETNNRLNNLLNDILYKKKKFNNKNIVILSNVTFCEKLNDLVKCKNLYEESYKEVFNFFKPKSYLLSPKNNLENIVHIRFGDKFLNEATASKNDNRSGDPEIVKTELLEVYERFGKCKLVSDNIDIIKGFGVEFLEKFDTHTDPICKKNCLDVCRDYNNKYEKYHGRKD
jgi:hypothetical protein